MTKFLFKTHIAMLVVVASHQSLAQTPAPTTSATASDVAALRQQVEALTETVKALQQQVKDQQAALEKANITGTNCRKVKKRLRWHRNLSLRLSLARVFHKHFQRRIARSLPARRLRQARQR